MHLSYELLVVQHFCLDSSVIMSNNSMKNFELWIGIVVELAVNFFVHKYAAVKFERNAIVLNLLQQIF